MKYTIGTGYMKSRYLEFPDVHPLWEENTFRFSTPQKVVCIANGGHKPTHFTSRIDTIALDGNLGDTAVTVFAKKNEFTGWSATVMATAMIAYCNETDFIYKEQDVLAFGDWTAALYSALGDGGMVFGWKPDWPCANSLFLVRHKFIPWFIRDYIHYGPEDDHKRIPEQKFAWIRSGNPKSYRSFEFGFDNYRPADFDAPVFYAQRLTVPEIEGLQIRKLI